MPDYIYLLENRLSPGQQTALKVVRDSARNAQMTVFLTGGAVRDLTSGSPVRDLDFAVQGNALKLKKALEKAGGVVTGEEEHTHALYLHFQGGARAEISSTRHVEYPKPGKPVYQFASIHEDLRRRDFTANAMALSLNEGSYGLLMDPLNGVADIESRILRLVSNYGFLEQPSLLLRATRFAARLGWVLEEKTQTRFDNAREEGIINLLSDWHRGYELEEIGHEEDALRILKVMEDAGWMKHLHPAWTSAKADVAGLDQMREVLNQLQMQGVNPDTSSASLTLLTAKMSPKELADLKKLFVRPGFVEEWNQLDAQAKEFAKVLTSKQVATPSAAWKLLTTSSPEAVLWLGFTSKNAAVQEKFHNFFSVWPEARQKIPYVLMQAMRITPELEGYQALLQSLFFEFIDGNLESEEQIRAFLEPFSPPAPPPPVTVRRTRGKKATGAKAKSKLLAEEEAEGEDLEESRHRTNSGLDSPDDAQDESEDEDGDEEHEEKRAARATKPAAVTAERSVQPKATAKQQVPLKSAGKAQEKKAPEPAGKVTPVKTVTGKAAAAKAPVKKQPEKKAAKPQEKKSVPVASKLVPSKSAAKKPAGKATSVKKPIAKQPTKVAKPEPNKVQVAAKGADKSAAKARPASKAVLPSKPAVKSKAAGKHGKAAKKKR